MAVKHQNVSEVSNEPPCLKGEVLTLMEIINIGRGAEPETLFRKSDLPDLWWRRYRDILQRVELGEIPSVKIYETPKLRRISLHHLAPLAHDLGDNWQWLRDICSRWEAAHGKALRNTKPAEVSLSKKENYVPLKRRHEDWAVDYYRRMTSQIDKGERHRPPSRDDDLSEARAAGLKITRDQSRNLRKKFAPKEWQGVVSLMRTSLRLARRCQVHAASSRHSANAVSRFLLKSWRRVRWRSRLKWLWIEAWAEANF